MADPTWMEAAGQACVRHLLMAWGAVPRLLLIVLLLMRVWEMANVFACLRLLQQQCAEGFCFCFFDLFYVVSSDSFFWAAFVFMFCYTSAGIPGSGHGKTLIESPPLQSNIAIDVPDGSVTSVFITLSNKQRDQTKRRSGKAYTYSCTFT
jgi:hypothetical protein